MNQKPSVWIEGVGLEISWADATRSLTDLIFDTVRAAVDDAGRGFEGIDSVVLAAHDLVDGRSLSSMVTAPAAGAYLRDEIRYGDDSAGAFIAGMTRIESGESERTIVAAWGRSAEHDVDAVSRALFDPVMLSGLGLDELQIAAMNAQRWRQVGGDVSHIGAAQARRAASAQANARALATGGWRSTNSWPLEQDHLPVWADVVAAVVISGRPSGTRVSGVGQSSEPYWPGDRKLAYAPALTAAAELALAEAGRPLSKIDVFEMDGLTLYDEAIAFEAIGLVPRGKGMEALAMDSRCNPSGGSGAGYCAPAMGLTRIVESVLQLRGTAGAVQQGRPKMAMASGSSLVAQQTQSVIVMETGV